MHYQNNMLMLHELRQKSTYLLCDWHHKWHRQFFQLLTKLSPLIIIPQQDAHVAIRFNPPTRCAATLFWYQIASSCHGCRSNTLHRQAQTLAPSARHWRQMRRGGWNNSGSMLMSNPGVLAKFWFFLSKVNILSLLLWPSKTVLASSLTVAISSSTFFSNVAQWRNL